MKTFILILALFLTNICSAQNNVKNITQWNLEVFTSECLTELQIDTTTIYIQSIRGLVFGRYAAVTTKSENVYIITLSDYMSYGETLEALAHELIHVKQYYTKRLVIINSDVISFMGKRYFVSEVSHYDDLHEIEARKLGYLLYIKFKPNTY